MEQQTNDLRARLLAALPQPENLAKYREETAALLSKHARALRWDYIALNAFYSIAAVLFFISVGSPNWHVDATVRHSFQLGSAIMLLGGMLCEMRYRIYDSQVATLKEIKQVQFQIVELQASLRKDQ
jgi:menaquinone-dependent protoporphyrinogen IX oxidase